MYLQKRAFQGVYFKAPLSRRVGYRSKKSSSKRTAVNGQSEYQGHTRIHNCEQWPQKYDSEHTHPQSTLLKRLLNGVYTLGGEMMSVIGSMFKLKKGSIFSEYYYILSLKVQCLMILQNVWQRINVLSN